MCLGSVTNREMRQSYDNGGGLYNKKECDLTDMW